MPNESNQHGISFLDDARTTIATADRLSVLRLNVAPTWPVGMNSKLEDDASRALKAGNAHYSAAVLAELLALVRHLRVTSPDSILADIADEKIGKSLGFGGGTNTRRPGTLDLISDKMSSFVGTP